MDGNNRRDNWSGLACHLELDGERLSSLSREVGVKSIQLARQAGIKAWAVMATPEGSDKCVKALSGLGFDQALIYSTAADGFYTANARAEILIDALDYLRPSVVVIGASDIGKDIAPLAAAHYQTGLTADCTGLEILPDGNLLQVRPAFGGNVMAEILTPAARPQFATVRAGIAGNDLVCDESGTEMIFRDLPASSEKQRLKVFERKILTPAESITDARLIIAIGCGLKAPADIRPIRELADALGGKLAATRGLVERGWMPPSSQIGLSGHSVAPDLLITLGVSGSVQFMAGIGGAKYIIAVNNDPQARIFSVANLGLCCDLYETLSELIKIAARK